MYSCEGSDSRGTMPGFLVRFYHELQSHVMGEVAPSPLQARLADEVEVLRRCRDWLERLKRGEEIVVNLRPETDAETEYVWFYRPRMRRVLARIIPDLDELTGYPSGTAEERTLDEKTRRLQHRHRLAEPDPSSKPLTAREERAALREVLAHVWGPST